VLDYDFSNLYQNALNAGNSEEDINQYQDLLKQSYNRVVADKPGFISMLDDISFAKNIEEWVKENVHGRYDHFVVLGIGGSALGNIALQKSLKPINWNRMTKEQRKGLPTIDIWDNVDPDFIRSNLDVIDPSKTLFNVISKSGTTAEAMSNYLIVRGILEERGLKPKDHFVFTTDPEKGVLNKIIEKDGIQKWEIPPSVGGRFSVLTPVGLLSAAVAGISVVKLLKGAKDTRDRILNSKPEKAPACEIALHHYIFGEKNKKINVMFAYSNALYFWADWYRQLWAESLGKAEDNGGKTVNYGLTPVKAIGPTDQHSQVQLYNDGPNDKVLTFLKVKDFNNEMRIPGYHKDIEALEYLGGKSLNKLINSEQKATAYAIKKHDKPNMTITFPKIDEENVGEFIFTYEFATTLLGYMADINPFNQPGVEDGKVYTYALMGRKGFEEKRKEIDSEN